MDREPPKGRPLRLDPSAVSADPDKPAFLSRPKDKPVYYGFPILEDVEVDGFRLGMITDWEAESAEVGDAFVVAPDGSRCGINFSVDRGPVRCAEVLPIERGRWGVWDVTFPFPLNSRANAVRNLEAVVPLLRPHWQRSRAGLIRRLWMRLWRR